MAKTKAMSGLLKILKEDPANAYLFLVKNRDMMSGRELGYLASEILKAFWRLGMTKNCEGMFERSLYNIAENLDDRLD